MAQTTDPTKATTKPTMSHAIPFVKNHLGIGALVAAIIALINSKLSVVAPPWVLWVVVGALVLGWIVHVIVTDHVTIEGAMHAALHAAQNEAAKATADAIKEMGNTGLPAIADAIIALVHKPKDQGGQASSTGDPSPKSSGPSGLVGEVGHVAETIATDVAHVVEDLTGKHPATVQSSAPTTPADSSSPTAPATTSAQG